MDTMQNSALLGIDLPNIGIMMTDALQKEAADILAEIRQGTSLPTITELDTSDDETQPEERDVGLANSTDDPILVWYLVLTTISFWISLPATDRPEVKRRHPDGSSKGTETFGKTMQSENCNLSQEVKDDSTLVIAWNLVEKPDSNM